MLTEETSRSAGRVITFPGTNGHRAGATEADAEAREQALDVERSWIVEAPAGSGKTGLLVQRYLKLLGHASVQQPEEVLAVTFTRKATAELRERVLAELEKARKPAAEGMAEFEARSRELALAVLERDAALIWGLMAQPQRLRVRTIDALCVEIAAALPLLSGGGQGRTPVENAEPMYRQAAQRVLLQLGGEDRKLHEALRLVLLHRDGNLGDCETLLARMLATREQWGELVPLGEELEDDALENVVRPRLEKALEEIACEALTRAARAMPQDALRGLTWLAARMAGADGYKGAASPIALCAGREEAPGETAEDLEHWLALIGLLLTGSDGKWRAGFNKNHVQFEIEKTDAQMLKEIVESIRHDEGLREVLREVKELPPVKFPENQWAVAKALFQLLVRALAELKVLFAERGECDFAEFSLAAKQALRAEGGVGDLAGTAVGTLKHLLVDEMQDTSSSQYELVEMLTRSWDGYGQTIFLVGDPKQSIYLFRQARVERFLAVMKEERIGDVRVGALRLRSNFRSQKRLVEGFNADFERIFPSLESVRMQDRQAVDVPFVPAEATRAAAAAEVNWHTAVLEEDACASAEGKLTAAQVWARHQAKEIRRVVEAWRAKPLPEGRTKPWRIAVLARVRQHLMPVLAEFKRADAAGRTIAFRAVNVEALGEQEEVLDVLALTRALLHPADRVAWLAVLHAPWCGLGRADLLTIAGDSAGGVREELIAAVAETRAAGLSEDGKKVFARAWPVLMDALAERGRSSTAGWVERTWRSLGGDAYLSAEQTQNVEMYLRALREAEETGGRVDLKRLKERVKALYAQPALMGEGAVELMTMHGAKGLEWDVVCVPSLERRGMPGRPDFLNWVELDGVGERGAQVVLAPIWGKGDKADKLYEWLKKVKSKREAAERKRLFYVACTRAKEELHVFGAVRRSVREVLYPEAGSLLQSAWEAAEPRVVAKDAARPAQGMLSFGETVEEGAGLALAAGAEAGREEKHPLLKRLPEGFVARERFAAAAGRALPYTPAAALRQAVGFERPAGSFGVRAFGNVVHRYLQAMAERMEGGETVEELLAELPGWGPRVEASLRGEGLAPAGLARMAERALGALDGTLRDETGRWILAPGRSAQSEQSFEVGGAEAAELRVDRMFRAGATPGSAGTSHVWIVDFKTTDPGSREGAQFAATEWEKYGPQLERYAAAQKSLTGVETEVIIGLYYPLARHLIYCASGSRPIWE